MAGSIVKSKSTLVPNLKRVLIVTHDVDWSLHGPGKTHVLDRQNRFPPEIIRRVIDEGFNPYFGVPKVMEIEEKFDLRSTFFFRPQYDDGSEVKEYAKTIRSLLSGGWEVGLHSNSTATLEEVNSEKSLVEAAAGKTVYGSRVHYLKISEGTWLNLSQSGIKYDSSLSFNKEQIDAKNTGYLVNDGLIVFPVTFMDAYLFTYLGLTEETLVPFMVKTVEGMFDSGVQVMTLLWHDNSVMMKGGRCYADLIERLSKLDVTFLKGIEAFELFQKQTGAKLKDE